MAKPVHWTDDGAIDAWLTWLQRNKGRSARTIEAYGLAMKRLREFLDGKAVIDANQSELETFCGLWLHKRDVVARSRIPYISAVRGFYRYARDHGIVKYNPAQGLSHPLAGKPLPRLITLANAERLMWAPDMNTFIGVRDALIMSLLIGCGMRVSGVVGLNEGDLSAMEIGGEVRMIVKVREKGQKERMLPLPKEADMLMRIYLDHEDLAAIDRATLDARKQPAKVLFVSVRSTKYRPQLLPGEQRRLTRKAVNDLIQRYGRKLDIPKAQLHPHAMRHLFGTELTEGDVPTVSVADLMGHSDIKSTAVYVHLAMKRKAGLVDRNAPLAKIKTPVSELLKRLPK